jgi:HD-GYP domain-containing protein (c-di-GMP phosphodiesterase class II)
LIRISSYIKKAYKKEEDPPKNKDGKKSSLQPDIPPDKSVLNASPVPFQQLRDALVQQEANRDNERDDKSGSLQAPISPRVKERDRTFSREETTGLYQEAAALVQRMYEQALNNETLDCMPVESCVNQMIEQMMLDNAHLFELTVAPAENYLFGHAVNVCILSLKIGLALEYDRDQLTGLGISAFLHDIGMAHYMDLAGQPREFNKKEQKEIRNHPIAASKILEKAKGVPEIVLKAVLHEHERIDGSGYPHGVKGKSVHTFANIIGMADEYEAMTHSRPYRDAFTPFRVMRKLIADKHVFEYRVLKKFIDVIGIYPLGSLVRLNTGETGKVIRIHNGFPTRPIVKIIYEMDGRKSDKTEVKDLTEKPHICVSECPDTGLIKEDARDSESGAPMVTANVSKKEQIKNYLNKEKQRYAVTLITPGKKTVYASLLLTMVILFMSLAIPYKTNETGKRGIPDAAPVVKENQTSLPSFRDDIFDKLLSKELE